jgi:hypothetical protein
MTERTNDDGKKHYHDVTADDLEKLATAIAKKIAPHTTVKPNPFWGFVQKILAPILVAAILGIGGFIVKENVQLAQHEQKLCLHDDLLKEINVKLQSLPAIETKVDLLIKGQIHN